MPNIITTLLPLLVAVTMIGLVQAQAGGKGRCDIDERVRLALRTMNSATVCFVSIMLNSQPRHRLA